MFCCFDTGPQTLEKPNAINKNSSIVTLTWNSVRNGRLMSTYNVYWIPAIPNPGSQTGIEGTSAIITGLQSNTAYVFQVSAVNNYISSQISDNKTVLTGTC